MRPPARLLLTISLPILAHCGSSTPDSTGGPTATAAGNTTSTTAGGTTTGATSAGGANTTTSGGTPSTSSTATSSGGPTTGTGGATTGSTTSTATTAGVGGTTTTTSTTGSGGSGGRVLGEANGSALNPIVSHVFTADPAAAVYDGKLYVYTSHDPDDQMGWDMLDYHVFSSDDLVNWQDHGVILDVNDISWATSLYAPDSLYSPATGKYYLYFPDGGSSIGVAVADRPEGPFQDVLGQPLISQSTPGAADVDWVFDPMAFRDDDGQAYIYFGGGPSGTGDNARVIRLNEDMISVDGTAQTIPAPDFFEASFMHKREGKYYFSYSTSFDNHAAHIDYMVSDNPMTGFVHAGTVLAEPQNNNGDNNHHSIIEYQGEWYLFYHTRTLANRLGGFSNYQRSITLDHLSYDSEGNINQVPAVMGEVKQLKAVDGLARIEAETMAAQSGIETDFAREADQVVGVMVTDVQAQDWIAVSQVDFASGVSKLHLRVASATGASVEVMLDGCAGFRENPGSAVGTCQVPDTGGAQSWADVECEVAISGGVHDLCLRFGGSGGQLLDLDYYRFE